MSNNIQRKITKNLNNFQTITSWFKVFLALDLFVAPGEILEILSLILAICGKKEDNDTIYQVTGIKQKLSTILWIHLNVMLYVLNLLFNAERNICEIYTLPSFQRTWDGINWDKRSWKVNFHLQNILINFGRCTNKKTRSENKLW